MVKNTDRDRDIKYAEIIKWCQYIVKFGYLTIAIIILAHVIWCFGSIGVLVFDRDVYFKKYIILPTIGLFALNFLVDLIVRFSRFSLVLKKYLSLSLFIIFAFYLCVTHEIATVLFGFFVFPIFISTIFSNIKITRWMFWMSSIALLLLSGKIYYQGNLDRSMFTQIFLAYFMFLCAYFLAKILIIHSHDNLVTLTDFDIQQKYLQEQLRVETFTGLYNKKTFTNYLPKYMEESKSADKKLLLAMFDIDNFKYVNDCYGHGAGDRVLLYLSQILKDVKSENMHVFRIGGDEFAILFGDGEVEEAHRICENIRVRMGVAPLREANNEKVTLSCGLVCLKSNTSMEKFLECADSSLYQAKNTGRNRVVVYDDSIGCDNESKVGQDA